MALAAAIPSPYGAVSTFWTATEATISLRSRQVDVTVRGWLDQAAFEGGMQPLDQRRLFFGPTQLDTLPGGAEMQIGALVELLVLGTPEFAPPAPVLPEEPSPDAPAEAAQAEG